MYGVESCVHPEYRSKGVGSKLMDARFDVLRRLNLRGLVAGACPMDYHHVAHEISVQQYVQDVIDRKRSDTNLSKQLHKGFKVHNLIPDYIHDPRTLDWGVCIVWDNPDYVEGKQPQPALVETSRVYSVKLKQTSYPLSAAGS
jgi:ribosomal protein S18 acetylase RimI-like enzyme